MLQTNADLAPSCLPDEETKGTPSRDAIQAMLQACVHEQGRLEEDLRRQRDREAEERRRARQVAEETPETKFKRIRSAIEKSELDLAELRETQLNCLLDWYVSRGRPIPEERTNVRK